MRKPCLRKRCERRLQPRHQDGIADAVLVETGVDPLDHRLQLGARKRRIPERRDIDRISRRQHRRRR